MKIISFPQKYFLAIFVFLFSLLALFSGTQKSQADNYYAEQIKQGNIYPDKIVVQTTYNTELNANSLKEKGIPQDKIIRTYSNKKSLQNIYSIDLTDDQSIEQAIDTYKNLPGVTYAGPEYVYRATLTPNDTLFTSQWNLHNTGQSGGTVDADIDAPAAWNIERGTASTVVAVVDSGVQFEHSDFLSGNIWNNSDEDCAGSDDNDGNGFVDDCKGWDFVDNSGGDWGTNGPADNDPSPCGQDVNIVDALDNGDCDGIDNDGYAGIDGFIAHGTHVAGIVAATQNNSKVISGIAPGARIMMVRALSEEGYGMSSEVYAAINYAIDNGADIVNMSFGSDVYDTGFDSVVRNAISENVVLVAAAGNASENLIEGAGCDSPVCNDDPDDNGKNGVLAVAATDRNDRKSSFSNYSTDGFIDVAAPGQIIYSTCYDNGLSKCSGSSPDQYASMSGTSQASPNAAGVAALLLSANPTLSYSQIIQTIKYNGDNITSRNVGYQYCDGEDCTTGDNGTIGQSRVNAVGVLYPLINYLSKKSGSRGDSNLEVTIKGANTSFSSSSRASFGEGINIKSLSCSSATVCLAKINITNSAYLGEHPVSITTGSEVAESIYNFTVSNSILRLSGVNRIETAIAVSKNGFPNAKTADTVIVGRADNFPDNLAAAPLAGLSNGVILFTPTNYLAGTVAAEIKRVLNDTSDSATDIYILGQTSALNSSVERSLKNLNSKWQVKRLGGANRVDTARLIAEEEDKYRSGDATHAFLATQSTFPDALSAGVPAGDLNINSKGMPILLTDRNNLSAGASKFFKENDVKMVYILGGIAAISDNVKIQVSKLVPSITRIWGADRYATAQNVSQYFYKSPVSVSFATGLNFPDAMSGGWLSAKRSSPMLLVRKDLVPDTTIDYVDDHRESILGGFMFGGTAVISETVHDILGDRI